MKAYKGRVLEEQTIKSDVLGKAMKYSIYLPIGYEEDTRTYPILYLLHGAMGDHNIWLDKGDIDRILDQMIADKRIKPMIVIMPDFSVDDELNSKALYTNDTEGQYMMEDYMMKEFIPQIEMAYRVKKDKAYRYVAGSSMGAFAGLYYSLKYNDLFDVVISLSAALLNDRILKGMPQQMYNQFFGRTIGLNLEGEERINQAYKDHNIKLLFNGKNPEELSAKYFIDCGDKDMRGNITETNCELHISLCQKGIPHEFRMDDGAHKWVYWRKRIVAGLEFLNGHMMDN